MCLRRGRSAQSRQGVSDAVGLHRAGTCACEARGHAPCGAAAFLMATFRVSIETDVAEVVGAARESNRTLEIVGHGTKRGFGRPVTYDNVLDLSGLSGI